MKTLKFLPILALLASCKSYMEYTAGIKELDYSFDHATVRRFHDLETALNHPEKVIFLDINLANVKEPEKILHTLNTNVGRFTHLKKLTLDGDDKFPIPLNIFAIESLEFLALNSFNDSVAFRQLSQLQNLKFLSLDFCDLQQVPTSVLKIKNLQGLDLTGNELRSLPSEMANLSELRTIDLTNNMFTEVPPVLKDCNKLKYIDINNAEGTDREKLKEFHVGVNQIQKAPQLSEFKSLKELYITYAYDDSESLQKEYANVKVR